VFSLFNLVAMDNHGKVLGHFTAFYRFNTNGFKRIAEPDQFSIIVELASESQTPGPGKDGGDRVGRGGLACLVVAEVAGYRTMSSLGFHYFSVGCNKHRCHQSE
jgi:hypothetical protein